VQGQDGDERPPGVVLAGHGHPENCHGPITDELNYPASACVHDLTHQRVIPLHHGAHRFGIHALFQGSRTG
jgi:hypothetical protein